MCLRNIFLSKVETICLNPPPIKPSAPRLYPDMSADSRAGPKPLMVPPSPHWLSRRGKSSTGTPSVASRELGQPPAELGADRSSSVESSVGYRPLVYMASLRRELVVRRSAVPAGCLRRELPLSMAPLPRAPPDSSPRPPSASRVSISCCRATSLAVCQTAPPYQRASSQTAAIWRCHFPLLLRHSRRKQQPHQMSASGIYR